MKRFRYVGDPLFLICCALYATNRWVVKPQVHLAFFHAWFNDGLLIPCALPPLLLLQRWLGLRAHDGWPTLGEIVAHLVGWSVLFEWIGPHIMKYTTGDVWDVAAYATGAVIAFLWWRSRSHLINTRGGVKEEKNTERKKSGTAKEACALLTPRRQPKSLAAPSTAIDEMASEDFRNASARHEF